MTDCYMDLKPDFDEKSQLLILSGKNIVTARQESTVSGRNIASVQLEISVQIIQNVTKNLSTTVAWWPLATTVLWMANILPLPMG